MNPLKKLCFVLSLCCVTAFSASGVPAAERSLVIVGESYPPFEFEKDGQIVGIDIDILSHILKRLNVAYEVRIIPWKRAWKMIELGEADASLSTSRKDSRKPFLYYPDEDMWTSEYVFLARGDMKHPVRIGYEEAVGKKLQIGVIAGNSYHDSFWKYFPKNADGSLHSQLSESYDVETNIRLLAYKRIDLYVIDRIIGRYTVRMMGLGDRITYSQKILFSKGYPMPFAKKSDYPNIEKLAKQFEEELIQMKMEGEYQKIMDKWLK